MANFIGLVALNAANFESGEAEAGQVFTADGAGGAAFEDAAGGGDLVDGVNFEIGELVGNTILVNVLLNSDVEPYTNPILVTMFVSRNGEPIGFSEVDFSHPHLDKLSSLFAQVWINPSNPSPVELTFGAYDAGGDSVEYYLNVALPSGLIVTSDAMTVPID